MNTRPPTRYTEEGISLPERGSGYTPEGTPVFDQRTREDALKAMGDQPSRPPSSQLDSVLPGEPEKLTIPAESVGFLLMAAMRSQEGNAWWQGFVAAHGFPSWITSGQFLIEAADAVVKRGDPRTRRR